MRKPLRTRNNPKARKVDAPPAGVKLANVAANCRYVGSPYHKERPGFAGPPRRRPGAGICPDRLANRQAHIQKWLRSAVTAGHVGRWDKGFPRYVWYRDPGDGAVYEARQGSPGSGEYHGYPLYPTHRVRGLP